MRFSFHSKGHRDAFSIVSGSAGVCSVDLDPSSSFPMIPFPRPHLHHLLSAFIVSSLLLSSVDFHSSSLHLFSLSTSTSSIHSSRPPLFHLYIILRSLSSSLVSCELLVLLCIPSVLPFLSYFWMLPSSSLSSSPSPAPHRLSLSLSPAERGIKNLFIALLILVL